MKLITTFQAEHFENFDTYLIIQEGFCPKQLT